MGTRVPYTAEWSEQRLPYDDNASDSDALKQLFIRNRTTSLSETFYLKSTWRKFQEFLLSRAGTVVRGRRIWLARCPLSWEVRPSGVSMQMKRRM